MNLQTLALSTQFNETQLIIECSSISIAKKLVIEFEDYFALWAKLMSKTETIIKSPQGSISIPSNIAISVPSRQMELANTLTSDEPSKLVWFANVGIAPAILQIANDLMENPRKTGVVRLSDELQILMSDGCKILNPGHTLQEATTWTRSQFWHPQDLVDFRRDCQQRLNADGSNTIEFTWRSFDPALGFGCREPGNWLEFSTSYKLFDGGSGEFYQVCNNLGMREIEGV